MNREEIIERFKDKGFNEETINLLLGVIEEFESIGLTKYVSIEEMVNRICKNLSQSISFEEIDKKTEAGLDIGGFYSDDDKRIVIQKKYIKYLKKMFFHEMMHCITYFEEEGLVGFFNKWESNKINGYGINEAMTELLTNRRNQARDIDKRTISYPILVILMENLLYVIGEDEILDSYFNAPMQLEEILSKHNIDFVTIVESFNKIHLLEGKITAIKYASREKKILKVLLLHENEIKALYDVMGEPLLYLNMEMIKGIGEINSLEDLEKLLEFIKRLRSQKLGLDENTVYGYVLQKIKQLQSSGYDIEEIEAILEENGMKASVDLQKKFESLISEDKNETLCMLQENDMFDTYDIFENEIYYSYKNFLTKYFYGDREEIDIDIIIPIGELLKSYPDIEFDEITSMLYYIPEAIVYIFETSDNRKFALIDGKLYKLQVNGENTMTADVIIGDETVKIVINKNGTKFFRTKDGEEIDSELWGHISSNLEYTKELIEKEISQIMQRISKLERLKAPPEIIEGENAKIREKRQKVENIEKRIDGRRKRAKNNADQSPIDNNRIDSSTVGKGITPELGDTNGVTETIRMLTSRLGKFKNEKAGQGKQS